MVYHSPELDRTFAALADPTRRAIIAQLAGGERTISQLAGGFAMSLPAVSKHVRVLQRAGLASVRKDGRVRRTELVAEPLREVAAWLERYRRFWEHQLDLVAQYLESQEVLTDEPREEKWSRPRKEKGSGSSSAARSPRRRSGSSRHGRDPKR